MKRIFCLLCLLTCVGASHAATMCVPDLSTCESCTDYERLLGPYGVLLKANCCGVPVVLVWVGYSSNETENRSFDLSRHIYLIYKPGGGYGLNVCMMVSPFVAPYGVVFDGPLTVVECERFIPRCAFTYCDEVVEWDGYDGGGGGGAD